jgi:hypothetical protein
MISTLKRKHKGQKYRLSKLLPLGTVCFAGRLEANSEAYLMMRHSVRAESIKEDRAMKKSILLVIVFVFITVFASGCAPASAPIPTPVPPTLTPSPGPPTSTPEPTATATAIPSSWEVYTNEAWGFSLEYPTAWVVADYETKSGFIGKQVYWWADNYDPMKQSGDNPAVDQVTDISIDGQPATRVLGHYVGAVGDMGFQQYLKYVIKKGEVFYTFTLFAVDALGVPSSMMTETQPLREDDIALFEQMMATLEFNQ